MSITRNQNNNSESTVTISSREDHYYNNNIHTEPGVSLSPEELERIKESYHDNISDTLTGAVANEIIRAINGGLTVDEVIMAIEETGFAPRPSAVYLRKILMNWSESGVTVSRIRHYSSVNKSVPWWK